MLHVPGSKTVVESVQNQTRVPILPHCQERVDLILQQITFCTSCTGISSQGTCVISDEGLVPAALLYLSFKSSAAAAHSNSLQQPGASQHSDSFDAYLQHHRLCVEMLVIT